MLLLAPASDVQRFPYLSSAPNFFTADSLQCVSTQPATVVMQYSRHAHETHAYLPTYFAVTLSVYTLIPTVYRALLNSAVPGTDHRIHTTKKTQHDAWAAMMLWCNIPNMIQLILCWYAWSITWQICCMVGHNKARMLQKKARRAQRWAHTS